MTDDDGREETRASRIDPRTRWGDPETRWGNPETDLPKIPRVRIPGEDDDEDDSSAFDVDVDPEQARLFWASVVLANVGLAGLAIGPMLVYFRGQVLVGVGAMLLGVLSLWRVYALYREYSSHDWAAEKAEKAARNEGAGEDESVGEGGRTGERERSDGTDADERNR